MKRLIKKSNMDLNQIIFDLSVFLSEGIESVSGRSNLNDLINNLIQNMPSLESSGMFYRGLILNYNVYDFIKKMSKVNTLVNEAEEYLDTYTIDEINEKQKYYKNNSISDDLLAEIKNVCKSEIDVNDNYYSFSKTYQACFDFLFNAAPTVYSGDIYVMFTCNTRGLDIEKLNNAINDINVTDETKQKFNEAYRSFGYQKEVLCKMTNIEICQFQNLNLKENNSLYDLLINCECDFYV